MLHVAEHMQCKIKIISTFLYFHFNQVAIYIGLSGVDVWHEDTLSKSFILHIEWEEACHVPVF